MEFRRLVFRVSGCAGTLELCTLGIARSKVGLVGLGGDGGEMGWQSAKSDRYRSSRCLLRYL